MPLKLRIDVNSYKSLKPLVALKVSNFEPEVRILHEDPGNASFPWKKLPILESDGDDIYLFSENAICSYFFHESSEDKIGLVNMWLEWECTLLQPCMGPVVIEACGGPKVVSDVLKKFQGLLAHLNSYLSETRYLTGEALSAADVAIWVCLYPLASCESLMGTYLAHATHVVEWFQHLASHPPFAEVVLEVTHGKGAIHFKDSFLHDSCVRVPISNDRSSAKRQEQYCDELTASSDQVTEVTTEEKCLAYDSWLAGFHSIPKLRARPHPVLPVEGERNVMITSALPYVNNVPHLGNIIGCVLSADVFARYCRSRNYNTLYICGTDEYGTATETKAIEEGVTPQEICDKYFKLHAQIYEWFEISFDYFGRTTTKQQTTIAQDLFWRLHHKNYLIEDSVDQLLCPNCNRFLADRFVEGTCPFCAYNDARGDQCDKCGKLINSIELKSPRCKLCKTEPVKKVSKHLFLDLPKLSEKLVPWFNSVHRLEVWSPSAKAITRTWLRDGLKPRCITRDLEWGVPVPLEGYLNKVFYVWFDAPIGYPSITAAYTDKWELWWKNPSQVKLYQFMAKDNVPFHSVLFPACLLGVDDGYTIISSLSAIEYLNYEDGKFSKSRGVGVFGNDARDTGIPADIWRFYLLSVRPETQDSAFSWSDLMTKNNAELLNNLGNFINRALTFLSNFFGGKIPVMDMLDDDKLLVALINRELQSYCDLMEKLRLRDAIRHVLNISRLGNQFIQSHKPWECMKKSETEKARAGCIIGLCANISCLLSVILEPYMPNTARAIQSQLNMPAANVGILPDRLVCSLPVGHQIGKPSPLFRKIENDEVEAFRKRFSGKQSSRECSPQVVNSSETTSPQSSSAVNGGVEVVVELHSAIAKQADIVRSLKSKGSGKSIIDAEVAKLLELKIRLSMSTGEELPLAKEKKKKSKKAGTIVR